MFYFFTNQAKTFFFAGVLIPAKILIYIYICYTVHRYDTYLEWGWYLRTPLESKFPLAESGGGGAGGDHLAREQRRGRRAAAGNGGAGCAGDPGRLKEEVIQLPQLP